MSLILDALNKSRQDADPVPGLTTQHPMEPVSSGKRQLLPWIALAVALVFVAWLLLERENNSAQPTAVGAGNAPVAEPAGDTGGAAPAATAERQVRLQRESQAPSADSGLQSSTEKAMAGSMDGGAGKAPRQGTRHAGSRVLNNQVPANQQAIAQPAVKQPAPAPSAGANDAVAKLYQQREASGTPEQGAPVPAPKAAAAQRPAADASQAAAPRQAATQEDASAALNRDEQQVDIEDMVQRARNDMEDSALTEHPAPFLSSLSQVTKDGIPTMLYQGHDYSATAARSAVIINGKSLGVGGSPAAGVRIDEILPESVVMSFRGTQFRLRSLNSWVNL